jgi:hypothetical protein
MKSTSISRFAATLAVCCAFSLAVAQAAVVNVSLNVTPTDLLNPNGGGTWRLVAKTDSPVGIAGISAYLANVNTAGVTMENDIGGLLNGGNPFVGVFNGAVNLVYGQDIANGPIVGGVGTILKSDGPDPFGDPLWNNATRIFAGTYSSMVPSFTSAGFNVTDANVLASVVVGNAAINADTTTVVRIAPVPEPATAALAVFGVIATASFCRVRCRA